MNRTHKAIYYWCISDVFVFTISLKIVGTHIKCGYLSYFFPFIAFLFVCLEYQFWLWDCFTSTHRFYFFCFLDCRRSICLCVYKYFWIEKLCFRERSKRAFIILNWEMLLFWKFVGLPSCFMDIDSEAFVIWKVNICSILFVIYLRILHKSLQWARKIARWWHQFHYKQ